MTVETTMAACRPLPLTSPTTARREGICGGIIGGEDEEEVSADLAGGKVDAFDDEPGGGGRDGRYEELLDGAGGFEFGGGELLILADPDELVQHDAHERSNKQQRDQFIDIETMPSTCPVQLGPSCLWERGVCRLD